MDKFLNERDRLASKRICDVKFDEISRDPIAAVRRIYDHFGWSLSQQAAQRMRTLVGSHAQRQPGNHRYHLSQFGFTAEEVLNAFAPYCQRFGLSPLIGEKLSRSLRDSALPKAQKRSGFVSVARNNGEADG
jgi:hypothetical protein